jgi:hypothetical protein
MKEIRCDRAFYERKHDAEHALRQGLASGKFTKADRPRVERLLPSGYVLSTLEREATQN